MRKKKIWIAAAALLSIAVGARYLKKDRAPAARADQAVEVRRGDLRLTIQATGDVRPRNRLEVKPPIAGRVEELLAREGDRVRRGQVLAWMSSAERAALLDAARARGPEELKHWESLYKAAPLVAPMDGEVIVRSVEPGQTVTAQDPVFVLSDRLIVKAQVDETDIAGVRPGQKARLTLDAYPDQPAQARVDRVAFEARTVNNVTVYDVDVLPVEVPAVMKSGMTANVDFLVSEKAGVLWVPAEAVQSSDGASWVRLPAGKGSRPERRAVETGMSDGRKTEILSGLAEGERVLTPSDELPKSERRGESPFAPPRRRNR